MFYAIISKTPVPHPIPLDEWIKKAQAHVRYIEQKHKEGSIVFSAPFAGRLGRITIVDVESNDKLFDLLNADPLFRYTKREIIPLVTNAKVYQNYELLKRSLEESGDKTE